MQWALLTLYYGSSSTSKEAIPCRSSMWTQWLALGSKCIWNVAFPCVGRRFHDSMRSKCGITDSAFQLSFNPPRAKSMRLRVGLVFKTRSLRRTKHSWFSSSNSFNKLWATMKSPLRASYILASHRAVSWSISWWVNSLREGGESVFCDGWARISSASCTTCETKALGLPGTVSNKLRRVGCGWIPVASAYNATRCYLQTNAPSVSRALRLGQLVLHSGFNWDRLSTTILWLAVSRQIDQ